MEEYPNICPDVSAWKARIGTILDQYGDEDLHELCREKSAGNHRIVSRRLFDVTLTGPDTADHHFTGVMPDSCL